MVYNMGHETGHLVLTNAKVITLDPLRPKGRWLSVRGGTITGTGDHEGEWNRFGNEDPLVIDCGGKTIIPGFVDSHFHLLSYVESFLNLDLRPESTVGSISSIQSKIRKFAEQLERGAWVRGRGYDEFCLAEKRHPDRRELDGAAPDHPVKLTHRSGHAHVLNTLGLHMAGISKTTSDPPGGLIERDLKTGEPTGLLYEMGTYLSGRIPGLSNEELERGVLKANDNLVSMGITSVQDASASNGRRQWDLFRSWKEKGLLAPRIRMMSGMEGVDTFDMHYLAEDVDQGQLRAAGVKIILDETTGCLYPPKGVLHESVLKVHNKGMQVCIHAIEETAIEAAFESIRYALREAPGKDHRHRIEHCSVCPSPLADKIASTGILVVSHPSFVFHNGDRYLSTVPPHQLRHLYAFGTLLHAGVMVAAGSDCPIVPPNPFPGISAAVSRKTKSGEFLGPEQGIPAFDALGLHTRNAAYASFDENMLGTLSPGKLADILILNGDPTRLPPDEIKDLGVEMTMIGGKIVWDARR